MKVLVANRGEIAIRILRACREMGLPSVALYTDADQVALHVRYANEAYAIGSRQNYLNIPTILEAARQTGAQMIHPGYGFLAENACFAQAVEDAGLVFLGPKAETIALAGDKLASRRLAREIGLPVLPGSEEPVADQALPTIAGDIRFPVLVKAAAGGGGRGIRLALNAAEVPDVVAAARAEALAAFGDGTVYLESMVQHARHIEVQILGDGQGRILCLGERECSIQRRHQKLIEEAPAPGLDERLRSQLYDAAFRLGRRLHYRGLGTVEFLLDAEGQFHFIEMNPRIQVEHPVTEMVTGMDLVKEQCYLALTGSLHYQQDQVELRGAAVEARVLAEETSQGFLPATGKVDYLKEPGGPGIRVDSMLYQGLPVGAEYDSLLAKVIAWGENRPVAIQRLSRALNEYQVYGISTNLDFLAQIIESPQFKAGSVTTTYLETFKPALPERSDELDRQVALAAALHAHRSSEQNREQTESQESRWQRAAWQEQMRGRG